jgi:hypothetical protein
MAGIGSGETGSARHAMPAGVRRALFAVLGLVLAGALYLIAVRGEALLADLSVLGQRIIACF